MNKRKDYSMLYAALAGFTLFLLIVVWFVAHIDWEGHVTIPIEHLFPEGVQVIEERDSHEFRDGVAWVVVQIPPEAEREFVQLLREIGFTDAQMPEELQDKVRGDPDTSMAADIPNCLWRFKDETPEIVEGQITDYTLYLYDLDTSRLYYIEYDS